MLGSPVSGRSRGAPEPQAEAFDLKWEGTERVSLAGPEGLLVPVNG
jgi:hypothetical protein